MLFLSWFLQCLLIMLSVAFFTLFERKVIGLFIIRLGPNKPSFMGLLQPLLDALKLFTKQSLLPTQANKVFYSVSPLAALSISLFVWLSMPMCYLAFSFNHSLLMFFCISSIAVFPVLLSGWSSNSKYSLIGSLRSVAQSISYESVFSTLLVLLALLFLSYSIRSSFSQSSPVLIFLFFPWLICTLAETHRAPFDFRESESELVSGFNTEYGGAYFSFIFLAEYRMLLYSCLLMPILFLRFFLPCSPLILRISALFFRFFFIWIRITFCRYRYDILITTSWKVLLPSAINLFLFFQLLLLFLI